jgi:hypothetical protein
MDSDREWLGKRRQDILSPIVATMGVEHEGMCFDDRVENPMNMKITFVKVKDMAEYPLSLEERVATKEAHSHSILLMENCRREMMTKV